MFVLYDQPKKPNVKIRLIFFQDTPVYFSDFYMLTGKTHGTAELSFFSTFDHFQAFSAILSPLAVSMSSQVWLIFTVSPDDLSWEQIPQSGEVPSARAGHTLW